MNSNFNGISCSFYTVKQLAALFGKSEDTIRRWKNEGIGREDDNIKLRAQEREDGRGRKSARHLVFSREAVMDFVRANPFLMDDAPQLGLMMQAEGAWTDRALPMPGDIGSEPDEDWEDEEDIGIPPVNRSFRAPFGSFDEARERLDRACEFEEEEDLSSEWDREWRRPSPFLRRGRRPSAAEEKVKRLEAAAIFALEILRRDCDDMEARRDKMQEEIAEVERSGMGSGTISSIVEVMEQKIAQLGKEKEMLMEFIEFIESELD